jgi:glycosyltransferase involved in cell wall biosynthesis
MADTLVSVVIPTFNRAGFLDRAIASVVLQTHGSLEILVVDDGSTDNTAEVVSAWAEKVSASAPGQRVLKYIQMQNRGVSAARNVGIRAAKASWIAFLDSDDEWLPEKLSRQLEFSTENPEISLIHCEEIWVRDGVRVNLPRKYKKLGGWVFIECLPLCFISTSTVLIKKDQLEEFSGFREDFPVCEDYFLWLQVSLNKPVGFVEIPSVIKYGGHPDQLSQSLKAMDHYRVLAIDEILQEYFVHSHWREQARHTLLKKCDVLLKGYIKHENAEKHSEILTLKERWL